MLKEPKLKAMWKAWNIIIESISRAAFSIPQFSFRSCKINCPTGVDCRSIPVSIKWFTVSRQGPIRQFAFRLIYDVDVSSIFNVRRVDFEFTKGKTEWKTQSSKWFLKKGLLNAMVFWLVTVRQICWKSRNPGVALKTGKITKAEFGNFPRVNKSMTDAFNLFTGNEQGQFGLQKYGFSKVIIYNRKPLDKTNYYHLKVVGTAVLALGRRIAFEYNLHAFFYVI